MEPSMPGIEQTLAQPSHLKHYQLLRCLGEGGFGQVFEAWDSKLCRAVAIKRLKLTGVSLQQQTLLSEARLAASLQHAAFVKIHALEEEGNSQSIVMELVRGQTLKQLLTVGPPPLAQTLDIVYQIARAMQEAHASGLTHGDLKPSNLMLEASGQVRILDFGLASQVDSDATSSMQEGDPQGTIAYMAPERLRGAALRPLADIYALGVVLYELLTGTRPFAHLSGLALAAAHLQSSSGQWPWPRDMLPELMSLVQAMTAKVVSQRLPDMGQVCQCLAQLAGPASQSSVLVSTIVQPVAANPAKPVAAEPNRKLAWLISNKRLLLFLVLTFLLLVAAWIALSRSTSGRLAQPYSEAGELKNGLESLGLFDRPGSLNSATHSFTEILRRNPKNAAAVGGLAMVHGFRYANDEKDEIWLQKARAGAQQALLLNDQLALSHIANAQVLVLLGKGELALQALARAQSLEPSNIFAWRGKVSALVLLRRYDEAASLAQQGIQRFPQERLFLDELGVVYYEQGKYEAAGSAFRKSIQLQPDAVYAYANLSDVLRRLNRPEEALQVLQQGLQIRPGARLYDSLGNALFDQGDYVGAAKAFEYAVSTERGNPASYLGWANLADTCLWIPGRENEAQAAYNKARELLAPRLGREPDNVTLVSRMGLYSARLGDKTQAERLMQHAVRLAPGNAGVHFRMGLAYELLGQREGALQAIAKARALGYSRKAIEAVPELLGLRRDSRYVP